LNIVGTALWVVLVPKGQPPAIVVSVLMVLATVFLFVQFARRVRMNLRESHMPINLNPFV
jgi:hypothetical protein